jgi:glutaminyl-peptide cyclotransferase
MKMRYLIPRVRGIIIMPAKSIAISIILVLSLSMLSPVNADEIEGERAEESVLNCDGIESLEFNGLTANESVSFQVGLGPRLPGSNASSALLDSFMENNTAWNWTLDKHPYLDTNLTNLQGVYKPVSNETDLPVVVLAAHYDSRDRAERDDDENRTDEPIPGANDGASGVAVLSELARIVPTLGLDHEVWILLTDAEDQGVVPQMLGAKAWAQDRTQEEIDSIHAFLLVDMIGDAYLQINRVYPPKVGLSETDRLWDAVDGLASSLGLVKDVAACDGSLGIDIVNTDVLDGVIDDHVPMLEVGIPAIDLIDIRFGPNATKWGGYWHTHEDTPDKVSAESLAHVGRILELGLRQGSWLMDENETLNEDIDDGTKQQSELSIVYPIIAFTFIGTVLLISGILHGSVRFKR